MQGSFLGQAVGVFSGGPGVGTTCIRGGICIGVTGKLAIGVRGGESDLSGGHFVGVVWRGCPCAIPEAV